MPGSDTPHPAQSHNKLPFKLRFSGFVPEYFLTLQDTEMMQQLSHICPNSWFYPIISSSCHICSYKGLHLFCPKGWIPFWTKHRWKPGVKYLFSQERNEEMDACRTYIFYLKCPVDKNLANALPCIKNFISGKNMIS